MCVFVYLSFFLCFAIKCVYAWLCDWWSHSLSLISICHFLTSHSGVDDGKKEREMDEDDCLSSVESSWRYLCSPEPISLKVPVKMKRIIQEGGRKKTREIEWVAEISYAINYHWQLGPLSFSPVLILNFLSSECNEPLTVCWILSGAHDCVNCSLD